MCEYHQRKAQKFIEMPPVDPVPESAFDMFILRHWPKRGLRPDNPFRKRSVVEHSCGIGRLAPYLLQQKAEYINFDISNMYIDSKMPPSQVAIVANSLEQLQDADKMFARIAEVSKMALWVVPDQTDLYNPARQWFFTMDTVEEWARLAGHKVAGKWRLPMKKYTNLWVLTERG